mmetsp:Transcript_26521/g.44827  ORF Transcript_26521/g.44827 Transcript_26521/m.44827 type:complete len:396 (-) Transcript_26521:1326-2513(-)
MAPKRRRKNESSAEDPLPDNTTTTSNNNNNNNPTSSTSSSSQNVPPAPSATVLPHPPPPEPQPRIQHDNSAYVVNVGGTRFHTSRQTLTSGSCFFEAALSRFAEGAQEDEFYVDRDPVPFPIILNYMRSGVLQCSKEQQNMLMGVVLEADFYGMDGLVQEVKQKCLLNLNRRPGAAVPTMTRARLARAVKKQFPTAQELVQHEHFPRMYFEAAGSSPYLNEVLSSYAVPENTFVRIWSSTDEDKYFQVFEMATIKMHTGEIRTEPMIPCRLHTENWRDFHCDSFPFEPIASTEQIAPVSIFLKENYKYRGWYLGTREIVDQMNESLDIEYTCRDKNDKLFTTTPQYYEVYTFSDSRRKVVKSYKMGNTGDFMVQVCDFSNFVGYGEHSNYEGQEE